MDRKVLSYILTTTYAPTTPNYHSWAFDWGYVMITNDAI
jgi:hypothetical protein